ncbi:MAG: LysM peptidoglycan-binding domain-containing protein [Phycisphaerales bacterium]|nr:LysM peptidoglycan-binding domain-containing protein [Phycisphaerales bacterium]
MTRETKIGLLVGLAFIIVIGILLSDHLTSATEPPPAPMSQAGPTVRAAITTPARHAGGSAEIVPPQVQPTQPVPTSSDLMPRPQPVKIVQVETPRDQAPLTIASAPDEPQSPPTNNVPQRQTGSPVAPEPPAPLPAPRDVPATPAPPVIRSSDPVLSRLNEEAARHGESVVPVNSASTLRGAPARPESTSTAASPGGSASFRYTRYKAEPGDTLSRIATKMYGTNTKALRDAIIQANPSLRENPDLVIVGRTYLIPAPGVGIVEGAPVDPASVAAPAFPTALPAAPAATYVVKEGDNLTRIAIEQCGDESALPALKELNRELLNGSDLIRPGMKLKLPARSVASNN